MKAKKSFWTSITGGLTSAAPILLSCCKSGACVGVCASPIASIFGISSATIASSPWISVLEPILIAISAVSFTVSYYSLYVLPKLNCNTGNTCDCAPTDKEKRKVSINKAVFWIGLILSVGFLSYFEIAKYQSAKSNVAEIECGPSGCSAPDTNTVSESEGSCCSGDSSNCADSEGSTTQSNDTIIACKLTSKELQLRKETVLASLKKQILAKKELPNGFAFKFPGTDQVHDELNEFVKTERACCTFFHFTIEYGSNETWLHLTGPKGAKEMITDELGL